MPAAQAQQKVLRIAHDRGRRAHHHRRARTTASKGARFLGYPVFEGLVLWDLPGRSPGRRCAPGLAQRLGAGPGRTPSTWIFHLRPGVTFHDGTPLTADAVIWNLDRYLKHGQPAIRARRQRPWRGRGPPSWPATARSTT
jgi:ABC-type transport system substrate-binding protein